MKLDIKTFNKNQFKDFQQNLEIKYCQTPAGLLKISFIEQYIFAVEFINKKLEMQTDVLDNLNLTKLALTGTEFQIRVWQILLQIPEGKTCSYQDIANLMGDKNSSRAVANAIANNKIAYFVPCHRVIRKDGSLGGYKWGIDKKLELLKSEAAI